MEKVTRKVVFLTFGPVEARSSVFDIFLKESVIIVHD